MDRRLLLAVVLSIGLLLTWQWLFPPPKPEPSALPPAAVETGQTGTPATAPAQTPAETAAAAAPAAAPVPTEPVAAGAEEKIQIATDLFDVTLTNRGGRVESWKLKGYPAKDGTIVELIPASGRRDDALPLAIDLDDRALTERANASLFRVEQSEVPAADGRARGRRVRFQWADETGASVDKSLVFRDGEYTVDLQVSATLNGITVPARLTWGPGLAAEDEDAPGQFHYTGQLVFMDGGVVTRKARGSLAGEERRAAEGLAWAGLEEQYFAAILVPSESQGDLVLRPVTPKVAPAQKAPPSENVAAVPVGAAGATLFVGPKKVTLLASLGRGLDQVVWFSKFALISWLAHTLFLALMWIHDHVVGNWGLAIILLTMALRAVLFPLNQYSMVNMRKMQSQMQRIQPKINAIRNKYKKKDGESRRKMNEEIMALHQSEGINPMGGVSGCLPIFAQMPILIAFYDVLIAAVELRGAPFFGWIHDLTRKDPYWVTPILMGVTMFLQQKMSMTKATDPAQAQQQKIMMVMPLMFTVMFLNMPSGLVLYWFVNNLLGILQQWLVNRHIQGLEAAPQKA